MHDLAKWRCRGWSNALLDLFRWLGKILSELFFPEVMHYSFIRNQAKSSMFITLKVIQPWEQMACSDSYRFSDHLSYINYFHLTYSLFYTNFQSLIQFLQFSGILPSHKAWLLISHFGRAILGYLWLFWINNPKHILLGSLNALSISQYTWFDNFVKPLFNLSKVGYLMLICI